MSDIIIDKLPNGQFALKELKSGFQPNENRDFHARKNSLKSAVNLAKPRSKIMYIAKNNDWDWFATLTIDRKQFVGMADKEIIKSILQFIQNETKRLKTKIAYLLVAEYGENNQFHFHGLIKGLPFEDMRLIKPNEPLPIKIKDTIAGGKEVYEWIRYSEKFGHSHITRLDGAERAGRYMIKEIVKSNQRLMSNFNGHAVFHSQGLNCEPERVLRGPAAKHIEKPDYETPWCSGKNSLSLEEALEYVDMNDIGRIIVGKP